MFMVIAVLALAVGIGGGLWFLSRSTTKETTPTATTPPPAEQAAPAERDAPSIPPPSSAAPQASAAPAAAAPAPTPSESAPAEATPAPSESAPAEALSPPPTVPAPSFDLEKIPGDRAALLVRSSAEARVFVHGKDYGETNQYLLTSCGIRFVRLGRGFNHFIEPGRSIVVKCGRVTEVSIEPGK